MQLTPKRLNEIMKLNYKDFFMTIKLCFSTNFFSFDHIFDNILAQLVFFQTFRVKQGLF